MKMSCTLQIPRGHPVSFMQSPPVILTPRPSCQPRTQTLLSASHPNPPVSFAPSPSCLPHSGPPRAAHPGPQLLVSHPAPSVSLTFRPSAVSLCTQALLSASHKALLSTLHPAPPSRACTHGTSYQPRTQAASLHTEFHVS